MKSKLPVIVLIVLALALGVALFLQNQKAAAEQTAAAAELDRLRSTLDAEKKAAEAKLADGARTTEAANTSLATKTRELQTATTQLGETKALLDKTQADLKDAQGQLASSQAAVAARDARIKDLTTSKDELEQHSANLKTAISDRDALIAETKRQLAASLGDRDFLLKELKRIQNEKGDLERQFNDLLVLKEQMKKLKEQYAVTKKIEWARRGIADFDNRKGAEVLQRGFAIPSVIYTNQPDLNVEFRRDAAPTIQPAPAK